MNLKDEKQILDKAFDICDKFEDDLDFSKPYNKTYTELMADIIEKRKVKDFDGEMVLIQSGIQFNTITGLGTSTYDRIKRRVENYVPSLPTFMTLCIVYDLDLTMALTLRESFGYGFNRRNRLHRAYIYLLVNCRGKSLSYCNKVLESLKIAEKYYLGDGEIDETALIDEIIEESLA